MAEELLKQGAAREEKIYQEAAGLEEAAEYVIRFERKVSAYRSTAKKFQSVSGYKDAAQRVQHCLQRAEVTEQKGLEETFALGRKKEQEARTKSDYIDAIAEYKRVWKKEAYAQQAKEHIDACKRGILRLETRAIWKKRVVTLAVLAVLVLLYVNTDAYPFTKGMVHQAMGNYKASIANFKEGMGVPWAAGKMKKSYLYLGQQYLGKGDKEAALKAFRKAENTLEAPEETAKLEQEILAGAEPGEEVRFGKGRWLMLERNGNRVLLLYNKKGTRMVYSQTEVNSWEDTKLYQWINNKFINSVLTLAEREISFAASQGESQEACATLLTIAEQEKYKKLLGEYSHNWWLKDLGLSSMGANYVDKEGTVKQTYVNTMDNCVRPAVWIEVK